MTLADSPPPAAATLAPFLSAAIDAARIGGAVIVDGARERKSLQVERKKVNDFVSAVDKASEQAVIALLTSRYPDHAIKAEESGSSGESAYRWLIDPLDGTTNFLHGFPHYCVSIALEVDHEVVVGVVHDPLQQRTFTATRGGGAWLDGERMAVSAQAGLSEAVVGTGLPFSDFSYLDPYLGSLREIMQRCAGVRRPGAAALDLAFVAAGWMDGFWEKKLNAWDVGAGSLLVREAGGLVSDFSGAGNYLEGGQMVAGTPGVHRELVEVFMRYPGLRT